MEQALQLRVEEGTESPQATDNLRGGGIELRTLAHPRVHHPIDPIAPDRSSPVYAIDVIDVATHLPTYTSSLLRDALFGTMGA